MSDYGLVLFVAGLNYITYQYEQLDLDKPMYIEMQDGVKAVIGTWRQLTSDERSVGTPDVYSPTLGYLGNVGGLQGRVYIELFD